MRRAGVGGAVAQPDPLQASGLAADLMQWLGPSSQVLLVPGKLSQSAPIAEAALVDAHCASGTRGVAIGDDSASTGNIGSHQGITRSPGMNAITLKLPDDLNAALKEVSRKRGLSKSAVVREALEQSLLADRKSTRLNSSHLARSRMPSSA